MASPSPLTPEENNPYAAPEAEVQPSSTEMPFELASLGERFFGNLLDNLMLAPMALFILYFDGASEETGMATENTMSVVMSLLMILFTVNLLLLLRNGQSLGKVILQTRIVDRNGRRAGFRSLILRRVALNLMLVTYVPFYVIVDALLIFRENRRCIHDHLAGTIVIKA